MAYILVWYTKCQQYHVYNVQLYTPFITPQVSIVWYKTKWELPQKTNVFRTTLDEFNLIMVHIYFSVSCLGRVIIISWVHPKNYAHCVCYVLLLSCDWCIFPYSSGLLHWHWGNHMIAPVPVNQPWRIWDKYIRSINWELWYHQNKTKQTICIFMRCAG